MLRAGTARCAITPPTGMTMAGYAAREGVAQDKDDDLFATALILDENHVRIAIIALDLLFIQEPLASLLREDIGRCIGIPRSHVLLNFSHTHCGPTSEGLYYDEDPYQTRLRELYGARLKTEIPALAALASRRLNPARIGFGVGQAEIGINRRERQADGSILMGENPDGPLDRAVHVLRVDDLSGGTMAVLFAHGCHPVTMGPRCLRWSSDFIGTSRELIERAAGGLALFIQANAGDINPVTGIGPDEDNTSEKKRLGSALGGEVLKVLSSIYTDTVRGPRVFIGSLSKIPYYPRIPIRKEQDCTIQVAEDTLELPLGDLPTPAEAVQILDDWKSEVSRLTNNRTSGSAMNVARRFLRWSTVLNDYIANGSKAAVQIPVQAIRVADLAIVAVPGETFSLEGIEVKRRSPFRNTLFAGYSNGCVSYIPTADAYPPQGWSLRDRYYVPDMIFQAYLLPTALTPECGKLVVEKSLDLLSGLRR